MSRQFALTHEDLAIVEKVGVEIRHLLGSARVTPIEIIGLGKLLYGLERLPAKTPLLESHISISVGDRRCLEAELTDAYLKLGYYDRIDDYDGAYWFVPKTLIEWTATGSRSEDESWTKGVSWSDSLKAAIGAWCDPSLERGPYLRVSGENSPIRLEYQIGDERAGDTDDDDD